jgi:hypothetical protein
MSDIKLIHLGQSHKLPFNYKASPEYVEQMVASQIKVATYIKNHPNALVFLEGLTESFWGIPGGGLTRAAKILFPDGLPDDAAKLNSLQKDYLYNGEDAVRTMNRLGDLKSMYRTISPKQSKFVDSRISKGEWIHIFGTREIAAMESIKEVMKKNPDKKEVILVFGDAHDFSKHCLKYGFQHEKVSCRSSKSDQFLKPETPWFRLAPPSLVPVKSPIKASAKPVAPKVSVVNFPPTAKTSSMSTMPSSSSKAASTSQTHSKKAIPPAANQPIPKAKPFSWTLGLGRRIGAFFKGIGSFFNNLFKRM